MEERQLVKPDLKFIKELKDSGAEDLKKCFQCATCSVVCELSPERRPFPRKEMLWAGWGLKEKLLGNPDIWLCHQCNDCSTHCPRGVRPGDVLAAVRSYSFLHYSAPKFLGKMLRSIKFLPILLAIPVILFLGIMAIAGKLGIPDGDIVMSKFMPYYIVDPIFIGVSLFLMVSLGIGVKRFWGDMKNGVHSPGPENGSISSFIYGVAETAIDIFNHSKFTDCDGNKTRSIGHLLIFFGFIMLFIVTSIVFMGIYIFNFTLPMDLTNPIKILANLGAVVLLSGTTVVIYNRLTAEKEKTKTSYFDWSFIVFILLVTITGIFTELFRLAGIAGLAYWTYFVHLITVFYLLAYMPFSKFAHMVYRTTAMIYSQYVKREA